MTDELAHAGSHGPVGNQEKQVGDQSGSGEKPKKKKASWTRTILWMLSMVVLVNVFFAVLAYILHNYKII